MKGIKTLLAATVMMTSFAPHADVGLNFHRDISPIIVQGEETSYSLFPTSAYQLENGNNQIVFRMAKLIESNGGDRTKFNSHAFVLNFDAEDIDVRLESAVNVLRENQAIEFNRNPNVLLVDEAGNRIDFTIDQLIAGDALMRDYTKDLAHYNKARNITVGNPNELEVAQVLPEVKVATVTTTNEVGPVSMIPYWMEKATAVESDQFMSWAFENRSTDSLKPIEGTQVLNMLGYWYSEAKVEERKQILAWLVSQ